MFQNNENIKLSEEQSLTLIEPAVNPLELGKLVLNARPNWVSRPLNLKILSPLILEIKLTIICICVESLIILYLGLNGQSPIPVR